MNYFKVIVFVWLLGLSSMAAAQADSLTVVPSIDLAFKNNRYSFPGGDGWDFTFKSSFTTLVPSVTFAYGSFYTSVNYDFTIADSEQYIVGTRAEPSFYTIQYGRKDKSITLGHRLLPTVNIFTGYTQGKGTLFISSVDSTSLADYATRIYNENGFYVGTSYDHVLSERGSLNISAAYGYLDGELAASNGRGTDKIISKAPGYSVNLSWNQAVTKTLSYRVGVKYTSYTFEGKEFIVDGVSEPLPRDFNYYERISTFYVGVVDSF